MTSLRDHALAIWRAAVEAVRPETLMREALVDPTTSWAAQAAKAGRIVVMGGGKAGAAMSAALEKLKPEWLGKMTGVVNVPAELVRPLRAIRLHPARPSGVNEPTEEGVIGTEEILNLAQNAGPADVGLCLLSGGGSALLPAPVEGVSLAEKQEVTRLLHECGASINEMNCIRKHLSRIKGGRLAQAFKGRRLVNLIISDVIGDPLDVIASGPTAADPTTFADAVAILEKYQLRKRIAESIWRHLQKGLRKEIPETLKALASHVDNVILGNNQRALLGAQKEAAKRGYRVVNLGSAMAGETSLLAQNHCDWVKEFEKENAKDFRPLCVLSGGETTVTLTPGHGLGGRNQEFVLAYLLSKDAKNPMPWVVLSGGTDGEDGPTDAAGALADSSTLEKARQKGLDPQDFLSRHDAYDFFSATGDLIKSGLTETNVMDVRVILVGNAN